MHHEQDHVQAVVGDRQRLVDLQRAGHPRRRLHRAVVGAEHVAHHLLQDQADAERGEQGLERPAVEEAHHAALDEHADAARHQERERNGDEDRHADVIGHSLLHHVGGVGAEHHELAMRHVDDAHDAERDREADGGEHQHASPGSGRRTASRASSTRCATNRCDAMTSRAAVRTRSSGSGYAAVSAAVDHGREPVVDIGAQRFLRARCTAASRVSASALSRSASARPSRIACRTSSSRFLLEAARAAAPRCRRRCERSISRTAASRTSGIRIRQARSRPPRCAAPCADCCWS